MAGRAGRTNTATKGTRVELMAIKALEARGYTIHRSVRTHVKRGPRFIAHSNDVYGCIDLIAKRYGERTRWIQVTSDSHVGRKQQDLAAVPWDPEFDSVEIWRYRGGQRRLDRRKSRPGAPVEVARNYFQVYRLEKGWALLAEDRVDLLEAVREPEEGEWRAHIAQVEASYSGGEAKEAGS